MEITMQTPVDFSSLLQIDGVQYIGKNAHEVSLPKEYSISEGQGGLITPDGTFFVWTVPPSRSQEIWQMPEQRGPDKLSTFGIVSCCGLTTNFDGYKLLLHGRYSQQLTRMLQYGLYVANQQGANISSINAVDLYSHNYDSQMNYQGNVSNFFTEKLGMSVTVTQHGEALPFDQLRANPMSASI